MAIITYHKGNKRFEYSIAVTLLDADRVLLTGMPVRNTGWCNGEIYYQSIIVRREDLADTPEARGQMWLKCGVVGNREDNVDVVPAICALLNCPVPGVFVHKGYAAK